MAFEHGLLCSSGDGRDKDGSMIQIPRADKGGSEATQITEVKTKASKRVPQ